MCSSSNSSSASNSSQCTNHSRNLHARMSILYVGTAKCSSNEMTFALALTCLVLPCLRIFILFSDFSMTICRAHVFSMAICRAHVFSMTICRAHVFILFRFQPPSGSGSFFLAALWVWLFLLAALWAWLFPFSRLLGLSLSFSAALWVRLFLFSRPPGLALSF